MNVYINKYVNSTATNLYVTSEIINYCQHFTPYAIVEDIRRTLLKMSIKLNCYRPPSGCSVTFSQVVHFCCGFKVSNSNKITVVFMAIF